MTKDIPGYDGEYQVDQNGNVISLKFGKRRTLWKNHDRKGYEYVMLSKGGKLKTHKVHRLVAFAFIPNDDKSKDQVDHMDHNPGNNSVSNLRWVTINENSKR